MTDSNDNENTSKDFSNTIECTQLYDGTIELEVHNVDIAFMLDTTVSISSEISNLAHEFSKIVEDISSIMPNTTYGFATFDDHNYSGLGSGVDKPLSLKTKSLQIWDLFKLLWITLSFTTEEMCTLEIRDLKKTMYTQSTRPISNWYTNDSSKI